MSADDAENWSNTDVRLLRIVMQELNEQAKQFSAFCVENQKWHEQHHLNIRTIMEATQFFASAIHNKLGVADMSVKLQQDESLFVNASAARYSSMNNKENPDDVHSRIMEARFDAVAVDSVLHSLNEKHICQLRPESAQVLLAYIGKYLRSSADEEFLLGAITLQELARAFQDVFVDQRNQAHVQLALRTLDSSVDRVRAIGTPVFGVAEAKALSAFLREAL